MNYADLTYIREETVDGIGPWTWIKTDSGAWEGPKSDWEEHHKTEYFRNVKKYDVCVQAGGCQGMYPRLLSELFQRVYTFEPDPLNFYCLTQNCQSDKIVKIQGALGNHNGMVNMDRSSMVNVGCHRVVPDGYIPQLQLDNFEFSSLDLLCLDVEGYEANILDGAFMTIRTHWPVITVENGDGGRTQTILKDLGYALQSISVRDAVYIKITS